MRHSVSLLLWIAVSGTAGVIGGIASIDAATFYSQLERPPRAPPSWLFGPVWTLLYLLMGTAAWLVWRRREIRTVATSLTLFDLQLAVNALWPWLFFAGQRGAWAVADITVLLVLVAATTLAFARVRPAAGPCMIPYLAWVAFAAPLNLSVWRANPTLLGS